LETVKSSIPARQKAPGTGISPWLREVSYYISRGVLRTGITARQCPVYFVAGDRIEAERRAPTPHQRLTATRAWCRDFSACRRTGCQTLHLIDQLARG
jgi:hypothetical protein